MFAFSLMKKSIQKKKIFFFFCSKDNEKIKFWIFSSVIYITKPNCTKVCMMYMKKLRLFFYGIYASCLKKRFEWEKITVLLIKLYLCNFILGDNLTCEI